MTLKQALYMLQNVVSGERLNVKYHMSGIVLALVVVVLDIYNKTTADE